MLNRNCIAFIPARGGSKRIPKKNIKILGGHPLIAYTIAVAKQSNIFSRIIVSTEDNEIANIAKKYGAEVPFLRPEKFATDTSPDIEWLQYTTKKLKPVEALFSILRPTSPFRSKEMITQAMEIFNSDITADSLRAVERCAQHPAKMWFINGNRMMPVMENPNKNEVEWYSTPMQSLPPVYAQNSSLEIAKMSILLSSNSIAGTHIIPYETKDFEGYDLNTQKDWIYAEYLIKSGRVRLPKISITAKI